MNLFPGLADDAGLLALDSGILIVLVITWLRYHHERKLVHLVFTTVFAFAVVLAIAFTVLNTTGLSSFPGIPDRALLAIDSGVLFFAFLFEFIYYRDRHLVWLVISTVFTFTLVELIVITVLVWGFMGYG